MPLALFIVGLVLIITSAQDTYVDFGRTLRSDFTGKGSFLFWGMSIVIAGAFGYIEKLRGLSVALMSLILLVLLFRNKTFFKKLLQELKAAPIAPKSSGPAAPSIYEGAKTSPTATPIGLPASTSNTGLTLFGVPILVDSTVAF